MSGGLALATAVWICAPGSETQPDLLQSWMASYKWARVMSPSAGIARIASRIAALLLPFLSSQPRLSCSGSVSSTKAIVCLAMATPPISTNPVDTHSVNASPQALCELPIAYDVVKHGVADEPGVSEVDLEKKNEKQRAATTSIATSPARPFHSCVALPGRSGSRLRPLGGGPGMGIPHHGFPATSQSRVPDSATSLPVLISSTLRADGSC
jgi:hypothetical protein